jgi:serine O-acetyltransferase
VWIGPNAVIVGKIKIGNNVLIAPNAYVNFDVPDNSIVIGNPATFSENKNATMGYINHKID